MKVLDIRCNTLIGQFCKDHPHDYAELLAEEPYCLTIKQDWPYIIFNYNQIKSDFNNPLVREARGIIFLVGCWEHPACWAFNKFGNYGESYAPKIDWSSAFVTQKIDGSLIKVWNDPRVGWRISTNSTIDAYKATINDVKMHNFGEYFEKALGNYYDWDDDFYDALNSDYTYMFELVGPYNRVVIPYEEVGLYFLGARNNYTGEEVFCSDFNKKQLGVRYIPTPVQYPLFSLKDCLEVAESYSWDREGFVVADGNFNRVKIKSPAYVLAHFMRNNNVITKKHLIKIILMNEVEEFSIYAADYKDELNKVQRVMEAYLNLGNKMAETCRKATMLSRGNYAALVKTFPKIFQGILFMNYEQDVSAEEYTSKWNENKWEEYIERMEQWEHDTFGF